jgi:hypothetical protein
MLVRRANAGVLVEIFIVFAVAAILILRLILASTGYPQLGGGGLHIAHMLWGGLLMLAAIFMTFTTLGRPALTASALVGGVGFGLFIDEVGKFVTSDNDYFYRPAVAIIYVVFVLLFLVFRAVRKRDIPPTASLANALTLLREGVIRGFTSRDVDRIRALAAAAGTADPVTRGVGAIVAELRPARTVGPDLSRSVADSIRRGIERVLAWRWFDWLMVVLFILWTLFQVLAALLLIYGVLALKPSNGPDFPMYVELGAIILGGVLVLIGAVRVWWSRVAGFQWFNRAVLVSLLLTQLFRFYNDQFLAIAGLVFSMVAWGALHYLVNREIDRQRTAGGRPEGV